MNPWALPALLAAISVAALSLLAHLRDPHAPLNRVFVPYAAVTAVLAFVAYGYLQAETRVSAQTWLSAMELWPIVLALQLHVVLVLRAGQRPPHAGTLLGLYASACATVLVLTIGWHVVQLPGTSTTRWLANSVRNAPDSALLELVPLAYAGVVNFLSVALCIPYIRAQTETRRRKQAMYVLAGVAVPGIFGFVCEGLLPRYGLRVAEGMPIGIALGAACVARGVLRYRLFSLDARAASDEIIDTMEEGLLLIDCERKITAANRAAHRMLCRAPERLEGRRLQSVLPPTALTAQGLLSDRTSLHDIEVELKATGDRALTATISARSVTVDGDRVGSVVVVRDVTESKRDQARLAHAATHDALTGLPNRVLLCDRIKLAIARTTRSGNAFAVVFVDLDTFKEINDVSGHEAGDALLCSAGALLEGAVRGYDTVARLGGDEFVIVLEDLGDDADAGVVAHRIASRLREDLTLAGRHVQVTASLGIAMFPRDARDAQTLLRSADIAMYVQKARGGDGFSFFAKNMGEALEQRSLIKAELQHALARHELLLHYQPLFDTRAGTISGMEALIRWRHPTLGVVSPANFIPVAEASGLIVPIGEWVLREACRQAHEFEQLGLGQLPLAVNLSAKQLNAPNLATLILDLLAEYELGPERLVLEVTESVLMEDEDHAASVLAELHRHGLKISLDDFGTGYSSLARLRSLPISTLKIDRSFIRHVAEDPADAAIVRAIVAMARSLKMTVVAEGIETQAQLDTLRSLEAHAQGPLCVDEVQGFLFSRPVDRQTMIDLLRARPDAAHAEPRSSVTSACA